MNVATLFYINVYKLRFHIYLVLFYLLISIYIDTIIEKLYDEQPYLYNLLVSQDSFHLQLLLHEISLYSEYDVWFVSICHNPILSLIANKAFTVVEILSY